MVQIIGNLNRIFNIQLFFERVRIKFELGILKKDYFPKISRTVWKYIFGEKNSDTVLKPCLYEFEVVSMV